MTKTPRVGWWAVIKASPGGSLLHWLWFHFCRAWCVVWFAVCYRYRTYGREHYPRTGPVLIVSNHESFLDSIITGLATGARPTYSLARATLFDKLLMRWMIKSLYGISIKQGEGDLSGMRRCIDVLKAGYALTVCPEGTRTPDGQVHPFASGPMVLIKRAKPVVVPMAIAGSFDAWPRDRKRPKLTGRIATQFGEPIAAETLIDMGTEQAMEFLRARVVALKEQLMVKMKK